jgi:hypothetical protein
METPAVSYSEPTALPYNVVQNNVMVTGIDGSTVSAIKSAIVPAFLGGFVVVNGAFNNAPQNKARRVVAIQPLD